MRVGHHVLSDGDLKLEILAAQGAVVRLFYCIAAVVVPQLADCGEYPLTLCALKNALLHHLHLLFWSDELRLLTLPVFVSVFDEAAAVLKGKAAFFAGEGRELILMRVKVPVEVERLAAGEPLPALFADQAALFLLSSQISIHSSVCLLIVFNHILYAVHFAHKILILWFNCALLLHMWLFCICGNVTVNTLVLLHLFSILTDTVEVCKRKKNTKTTAQ